MLKVNSMLAFLMSLSAITQSAFANESFDSIAKCGNDFFMARLAPVTSGTDQQIIFENPAVDFVCGGNIGQSNPRSLYTNIGKIVAEKTTSKTKHTVKAMHLIPFSEVTVGQKVQVLCLSLSRYLPFDATVASIRDSYVSYKYENPSAEYRCGAGRYYYLEAYSYHLPRR